MTNSPPSPPLGWQLFSPLDDLRFLVASAVWQNQRITDLMATTADLTAAVKALTDNEAADEAAAQQLLTAVTDLEAKVSALGQSSPEFDAAVQAVNDAAARLANQTNSLATAAAGAESSLNPTPAPTDGTTPTSDTAPTEAPPSA